MTGLFLNSMMSMLFTAVCGLWDTQLHTRENVAFISETNILMPCCDRFMPYIPSPIPCAWEVKVETGSSLKQLCATYMPRWGRNRLLMVPCLPHIQL